MKGDCADNLVKMLISKLKERDMDVDSFRIQKVLYKVKMELGENHPFWDSLPYYWYHFGPVSDVVDETVSRYIDGDFEIVDFDESYLKAGEIIDEITADEDYYFGGIERDIYENFAPFKVMPVFRFKIYETADKHENVDFDVEKYVKYFDKCNGNFPKDSYFTDFKALFSGFDMVVNILYKHDLFEKNWKNLRNAIKLLWLTFTEGIRVKCHEKYYNNNVDKWKTDFTNSLTILDRTMMEIDDLIIGINPNEIDADDNPFKELLNFNI